MHVYHLACAITAIEPHDQLLVSTYHLSGRAFPNELSKYVRISNGFGTE